MSIKWTLPTLILSLCASGALQANPLDSPGIVYIDGLPCNRACQSYMAASNRALSARHREERERIVVEPVEAEVEIVEHAARPRAARQPMPVPRPPRAGLAASNTKASHTRKTAAPKVAGQPASKEIPAVTAIVPPEKAAAASRGPERKLQSAATPAPAPGAPIAAAQPAEVAKPEIAVLPPAKPDVAAPPATTGIAALPAAAGAVPVLAPQADGASVAAATPAEPAKSGHIKSELIKSDAVKSEAAAPPPAGSEITVPPATLEIAALPAEAGVARALPARTIQQQVLEATGIADRVTAITLAREQAKPDNSATEVGEAGKAASGSTANSDTLVALVLARPEINSISDLNNKNIAIGEKQSAASGSVSAALMAAGAAEVQFSEAKAGAIERLIKGEVPAAVLTLASREAAEWFPDIEGFRIFRVPLAR